MALHFVSLVNTIPFQGSEDHRYESGQGLCSMLVTCAHVSHPLTKPKN